MLHRILCVLATHKAHEAYEALECAGAHVGPVIAGIHDLRRFAQLCVERAEA
jgi:hypothetical protein